MDHSHMDHFHMNHDSAVMQTMDRCNMNMLFTFDTTNLCIIFRWWHIRGPVSLVISLVAVVVVTALFEGLRAASRKYEIWVQERGESVPRQKQGAFQRRAHTIKALLYAAQSFYGLMLMLLFMTYNGLVMLSMAGGAFLGYLLWGGNVTATKDGACH